MIGFFDSGFGGLTILKEVVKTLPDYSFVYLGDNARTPYGSRSQEVIYQYTIEGVEELFRRGAQLVILACNTSSAVALKKIQKEYLPKHHPGKYVLGIIIPVAEEAKNFKAKNIGVFATQASVESNAFSKEIAKTDNTLVTTQQACSELVPIIEAGEFEKLNDVVEKYSKQLFAKNKDIDTVILGCTHYAIIEDVFRKNISQNVQIISQGKLVAESLKKYLNKHSEIEKCLEKKCGRVFLTTEKSMHVQHLAESFYGEKLKLEVVNLFHG